MEKSLLMQDSWRSNHGYEAMLDFQISWLLRLAAEKKVENKRLHKISKEVLLRLIEWKGATDVMISKVEVWRQWASIDVTAEVELTVDGNTERHLIIIEDKAYTLLHNNQLARYRDSVNDFYKGKHKPTFYIHYWVITFYEDDSNRWSLLQSECDNNGWKLLSFYDVIGWKEGEEFPDTKSDLFDEFWLREWY